jgi:hypothetical protein
MKTLRLKPATVENCLNMVMIHLTLSIKNKSQPTGTFSSKIYPLSKIYQYRTQRRFTLQKRNNVKENTGLTILPKTVGKVTDKERRKKWKI